MSSPIKERVTRKPYKVVVSLFPLEWERLRRWSELRGITGGELVSSIVTLWLRAQPEPPAEDDPGPDDQSEDA